MDRVKRWAWRILIGLVVLSAALLVARIVLHVVAKNRLAKEVALVRAAGEPLTLAEIELPSVADADNAARVYERIFDLLVTVDEVGEIDEDAFFELSSAQSVLWDDPFALDDEDAAVLQHWVERNAEALALLPEALERPSCQFEMELPAASIDVDWPTVEPIPQIRDLLQIRALGALRQGDLDAAFADVTLGVRVADQALRPPTMIAVLWRAGVQSELLRLAEDALAQGVPSGAALDRLTAAVERVDRDRILQRTFVFERAFAGSGYAMALDEAGLSESPGVLDELDPTQSLLHRMLGDLLFHLDHARYLCLVRRALDLADRPYFETRDEWQRMHDEALEGPSHAVLSRMFTVVWEHFVTRWVCHEARLDVTRLALHIERHRLETGSLPENLRALGEDAGGLVDPFSGEAYRYGKRDDGEFIVYSVGENGFDEGGIEDEDDACEPDIVFRVPARP